MPISKAWIPRDRLNPRELPGTIGVYELADSNGEVLFIGFAGGRSLQGLRGAIAGHFSAEEPNRVIREKAASARYEVTTNYLIRRLELLSRYVEDFGRLPEANAIAGESLPPLVRYRWHSAVPMEE
jgi:hypothetical protein